MFHNRTPLQKLLLLKAFSDGGQSFVERTATGNPLTFGTDVSKPLKSLLIPFTPVQSGTGDPSPENIRPIVPWNGLKVYHSGADTSEYTETDIVFPSPVYGGEHEAVSGKMTVKRVGIIKKWKEGENPQVGASYTRKIFNFDVPVKDVSTYAYQRCNVAPKDWSTYAKTHFYIDENKAYLWLPNDTDGELEVQFVAVLVTPQEIQLTPAQITALLGDNTIWSDADGSMTAVYLVSSKYAEEHPVGGLGSGLGSGLLGSGTGDDPENPDEPTEPDEPIEETVESGQEEGDTE